MMDIEKVKEEVEESIGRELTEKEKQITELFGCFMNEIWENESDKYSRSTDASMNEKLYHVLCDKCGHDWWDKSGFPMECPKCYEYPYGNEENWNAL